MLQNAAIDVAIALSLMYLMLSLFCTVINEYIATKFRLRARSLAQALARFLDDDALRATFYRHGLIVTNKSATATGLQSAPGVTTMTNLASSGASAVASGVRMLMRAAPSRRRAASTRPPARAAVATAPAPAPEQDHPSYLSSRSVALALIGSLDTTKPLPGIDDIRTAVMKLPKDSHIRDTLLASLNEAGGDLDKLRKSIATWFDDSMARLSGAYKRKLKWISMLVGLAVAIAFNADSFNVATTLWRDGDLRASVAAIGAEMAQKQLPATGSGDVDWAKVRSGFEKTESELRALPIGWNCSGVDRPNPSDDVVSQIKGFFGYYTDCAWINRGTVKLRSILGWIITAAALTLGAPFWFDTLQKFVNLRGAGDKPKREDEKARDNP
jgi:hypothetical protein